MSIQRDCCQVSRPAASEPMIWTESDLTFESHLVISLWPSYNLDCHRPVTVCWSRSNGYVCAVWWAMTIEGDRGDGVSVWPVMQGKEFQNLRTDSHCYSSCHLLGRNWWDGVWEIWFWEETRHQEAQTSESFCWTPVTWQTATENRSTSMETYSMWTHLDFSHALWLYRRPRKWTVPSMHASISSSEWACTIHPWLSVLLCTE